MKQKAIIMVWNVWLLKEKKVMIETMWLDKIGFKDFEVYFSHACTYLEHNKRWITCCWYKWLDYWGCWWLAVWRQWAARTCCKLSHWGEDLVAHTCIVHVVALQAWFTAPLVANVLTASRMCILKLEMMILFSVDLVSFIDLVHLHFKPHMLCSWTVICCS